MKYDNLRAFEKHLESSAPQHFSNLYFVIGKELFECKEATDLLLNALLPNEKIRLLGLHIFEAPYLDIQAVITELNSTSFFAQQRVIWIQQVDKLKKGDIEILERYITHPQRAHYLLLTASGLAKNSNFYKNVEKAGVILELAEIKSWEKEKRLVEWVNKQVAATRKLMSYQACQYLVKHSGYDSALLQQELEKLLCYMGDKKEISVQDIAAICTQTNTDSIWQVGEAIFRRDGATALRISRALLTEGNAFLPFLRQIRTQLQTGYQICTIFAQGGNATQVAQEYPYLKGQILERQIQLSQNFGLERFREGILIIDAIEIQTKNTQVEEMLLADLLIVKLTKL